LRNAGLFCGYVALYMAEDKGISTMFPDSWGKDRIKVEVDEAYKKRTIIPGAMPKDDMWEGITPSGVKVKGFVMPITVYPVM